MNISQEDLGVTGAARLGSAVSSHTSGPWWVEDHYDRLLIIGPRPNTRRNGRDDEWELAKVGEDTFYAEEPHLRYEDQANAYLMAAAPDLLAALKKAAKALSADTSQSSMCQQIRAAIAKAEGRSALSASVRKDAVPNTPVNSQSTEKE